MNSELTGKVALITGGSRDIGRAVALKLAGQGAHRKALMKQQQILKLWV